MPDICIASDFIVGFPTETDEDFAKSAELLKRCRFKNCFIFKYSPRPGTVAIDRYSDDVPEEVKRHRNNALLAVQQEVSEQSNRELVGKTVEVMVEGQSKLVSRREPMTNGVPALHLGMVELTWKNKPAEARRTQLVGRTRGDQVVVFDGEPGLVGKIMEVEIVDARNMTLFAREAARVTVES